MSHDRLNYEMMNQNQGRSHIHGQGIINPIGPPPIGHFQVQQQQQQHHPPPHLQHHVHGDFSQTSPQHHSYGYHQQYPFYPPGSRVGTDSSSYRQSMMGHVEPLPQGPPQPSGLSHHHPQQWLVSQPQGQSYDYAPPPPAGIYSPVDASQGHRAGGQCEGPWHRPCPNRFKSAIPRRSSSGGDGFFGPSEAPTNVRACEQSGGPWHWPCPSRSSSGTADPLTDKSSKILAARAGQTDVLRGGDISRQVVGTPKQERGTTKKGNGDTGFGREGVEVRSATQTAEVGTYEGAAKESAMIVAAECKPCGKKFVSEDARQAHLKSHVPCPESGCNFTAVRKVMSGHHASVHGHLSGSGFEMIDVEGQKFRVLLGTNPDEVALWRAERRKNWPSRDNISRKDTEAEKRRSLGDLGPDLGPSGRRKGGKNRDVRSSRSQRGGRGRGRGRGRGGRHEARGYTEPYGNDRENQIGGLPPALVAKIEMLGKEQARGGGQQEEPLGSAVVESGSIKNMGEQAGGGKSGGMGVDGSLDTEGAVGSEVKATVLGVEAAEAV
ncbi:unnamed protein product, partial [Choristocarpus tenellus]